MMSTLKVRLSKAWRLYATRHHVIATLLFDFLCRLKDRWQQTLVLHKRTIIVACLAFPDSTGNARGYDVLEVAVESLVFTVLDFQVGEVSTAMLCCQWALFHVDTVCAFLFLLFINVIRLTSRRIVAILIVERAIGGVVRDLAHRFRIYRHTLVSLLSHSKDLAHLRRRWSNTCANASFLD
jgi:hypothetical protein